MLKPPQVVWFSLMLSCLAGQQAHAWGQAGHELITRAAAAIISARNPTADALAQLMHSKRIMLSHLSNLPDTQWRDGPKNVVQANAPTHYFNFDKLKSPPRLVDLELDWSKASKAATALGLDLAKDVGTAPWRILQLQTRMRESFDKARSIGKRTPRKFSEEIDQALAYAGLLSHFVGDLANPMHAVSDFDGWGTQQGGLHAYFESDLVEVASNDFAVKLLAKAQEPNLLEDLLKGLKDGTHSASSKINPETLVRALVWDSHTSYRELAELDRRYAIIQNSSDQKGLKIAASRQTPARVIAHFEPLLLKRMAIGAEVLAALWLDAWLAAGETQLDEYRSYTFFFTYPFVTPNYIF